MKDKSDKKYWFNFATGEHDYIETPEDFRDYVPQIGGRGLYEIYVDHKGMKPIDAALKILSKSIGDVSNEPQ